MARDGNVDYGRFRPGPRPEELLPLIREISLAAVDDPDEVFDLTQTRFDEKAAELGITIQKAKSLASRFHVKWRELLELAHADPDTANRRLGLAVSDRSRKGLTVAECAYALRRVAVALGVETVSREQYATEREAMVARTGRSAEGRMAAELTLPTLNQIVEVISQESEQRRPGYDWDQLLVDAGLQRRDPSALRSGLSPTEAVELFSTEFGRAPAGAVVLRQWASARGLSCREIPTPVVRAEVQALNQRRAAEGLEPLEVMNPKDVDWDQVQPTATPTRKRLRPRGSWVKSNCVAGMAVAMTKLKSDQRLTQTALKRAAKGDADVPDYTQVYDAVKKHNARHGTSETFDQWREAAAKLLRKTSVEQLREMAAPVLPDTRHLDQMSAGFAVVREDPKTAAEFAADTRAWDATSGDGLRLEAQQLRADPADRAEAAEASGFMKEPRREPL